MLQLLEVARPLVDRWYHKAVCFGDPTFTEESRIGKVSANRERARHICIAHCPVVAECLDDATATPPRGVVMGGLVWADDWSQHNKPLDNQPPDPGCGPWCASHRGLTTNKRTDTLAHRLYAKRMAKGWSQEELAAKAGIRASTIIRIETGARDGRTFIHKRKATVLELIAEALETTAEELRHGPQPDDGGPVRRSVGPCPPPAQEVRAVGARGSA